MFKYITICTVSLTTPAIILKRERERERERERNMSGILVLARNIQGHHNLYAFPQNSRESFEERKKERGGEIRPES